MTETDGRGRLRGVLDAAAEPVDGASLAAYRIGFGLLQTVAATRFIAYGWVDELYVRPSFYFTYFGFDWVRPLPASGMYAVFVVLAALGVLIALGWWFRPVIAAFAVVFTYVELLDATNYLNHYYLVSLLALIMFFLPMHRVASLDAARTRAAPWVPRGAVWILRAQVGLVYFFAGVAKLDAEWLFEAQPLRIWLSAHADLPLVGGLLIEPWVAFAASWAAAAFDLVVPFLLALPRTRKAAFAAVVFFHAMTVPLFQLGMFPWIMTMNATLFFDPGWPRRGSLGARPPASRLPRTTLAVVVGYFAVQVILPLRHHLYPGPVGWTEEGGRFAWRVMLKEKAGFVVFRVSDASGRRWDVYPQDYLTDRQTKMMAVDPELVRQLAHHIRHDFEARGRSGVEVRAETSLSRHGAPSQRLVDPRIDLSREGPSLYPRPWIVNPEAP